MTTPKADYELLQIDPGASVAEVTAARRTLARKHHPDSSDDPIAAGKILTDINVAADRLIAASTPTSHPLPSDRTSLDISCTWIARGTQIDLMRRAIRVKAQSETSKFARPSGWRRALRAVGLSTPGLDEAPIFHPVSGIALEADRVKIYFLGPIIPGQNFLVMPRLTRRSSDILSIHEDILQICHLTTNKSGAATLFCPTQKGIVHPEVGAHVSALDTPIDLIFSDTGPDPRLAVLKQPWPKWVARKLTALTKAFLALIWGIGRALLKPVKDLTMLSFAYLLRHLKR
jgi:hypothetical protein